MGKEQLMMPGYKHPNLPKPLEQYVLSNSLSFSGHLNNNYFNNQRITYLGDSNLKHNPITCPIDDLEYNKYIINDLNKYLYDSKDKIGNNSNLDSAGDYNNFGGNYNSNNNRFASNGNMIINN